MASYPQNVNLPRSLTYADFQALARLARSEAGGLKSERDQGLKAVVDTILNRVASPSYPNSVGAVVNQGAERRAGSQFTPVSLSTPRSLCWFLPSPLRGFM